MNRIVLFAFASTLAACGGDDSSTSSKYDLGYDASAAMTDGATKSSLDSAMALLTESQSAQVVLSINSGEVNVANAVVAKLTNSGIQSFANEMITMHTQAKSDATTLFAQQSITPQASAVSTALDSAAAMMASTLGAEAAPDQDYINGQVGMHAQALLLVDCVLMPDVQNAAFKTMLTTMRSMVADHLEMAKMLGGSATPEGPDAGVSDCINLCTTGDLPDAVRTALCQ